MSAPATATVIGSRVSSVGYQLEVTVNLISPVNGVRITATIEPKFQKFMRPGQRIPVRYYYLGSKSEVLYAGPNGDVRQEGNGNYDGSVAALIVFAIMPLATGVIRLRQILVASGAPIKTQLQVEEIGVGRWTRHVRAYDACGGMDLEWRVLRGQPRVSGKLAVGGHVKGGHWLVIELPGKKYIWPGSSAQPVVGTGMQQVLPSDTGSSPLIDAHYRLLSAYVQIIGDLDHLPFMVRRQPGRQAKSKWWGWWFGAPRFVVRSLVVVHVRRRLRTLSNGLTRASMLTSVIHYGTSRTALSTAAEECRALAATLPRSTWRTVTAFMITVALPTGLTIYTAFVRAPPINVKWTVLHSTSLLIAMAIALTAPFAFNRSLWCKRVMFCPALASHAPPKMPTTGVLWDVYRFEREAFLKVGLTTPSEWEARSWVSALGLAAYILTIFMPLLFASDVRSAIETVIAILILSTIVVVVARNKADRVSVHTPGKRRLSIPWLRLSVGWTRVRYIPKNSFDKP